MKFFEIIFILLILLPVALLMRFFVSKLSAQTPMQRRVAPEDEKPRKKRKPAKLNLRRKKREKDTDQDAGVQQGAKTGAYGAYEGSRAEPARRRPEPYRDQDTPRSSTASSESSTRRHTELKRTQRIPFSELYGSMPAQTAQTYQAPQTSVSESVQKRISDRRAATKNAPRSEQEPSKRQKRRNRERARKRELARRDKDNKE